MGINSGMMIALKITADKIADVAECRFMMSNGLSHGSVAANKAGMMAKYLARSLAIENVVSAPRVISNCLPISTTSISLVGIAVEIDHVAGFLGGLRAGVHGDADVGLRQRGGIVRAVAHHGDQLAAGLLLADVCQLGFGRGFGDEIVDAGLRGDGLGGQRIVAGDHDRPQAHPSQPLEPLAQCPA